MVRAALAMGATVVAEEDAEAQADAGEGEGSLSETPDTDC